MIALTSYFIPTQISNKYFCFYSPINFPIAHPVPFRVAARIKVVRPFVSNVYENNMNQINNIDDFHGRQRAYNHYDGRSCSLTLFSCFVLVMLTFMFGLQVYTFLYGSRESLDGSLADVKFVVEELANELTEVYRKHENLQSEMERVSAALPAVAAAYGRARAAHGPALRPDHGLDLADFDRQVGDYALESAGARVLDTGDTVGHFIYESPVSWAMHALTSWVCRECLSARVIIQPGSLPGQCWAFKGAAGEATIRLLGTIYVTGFSVEHIPAHIDPTREILAAPRLIQLEGLRSRTDSIPHNFGTFEYVKDASAIQYFEVTQPSPFGFNIVRVKVLSNWGHPVYTCLYRVRVHGELLPGQIPKNTLTSEDEILGNE